MGECYDLSAETKAKMRAAKVGKPLSNEHRAKIKAGARARFDAMRAERKIEKSRATASLASLEVSQDDLDWLYGRNK